MDINKILLFSFMLLSTSCQFSYYHLYNDNNEKYLTLVLDNHGTETYDGGLRLSKFHLVDGKITDFSKLDKKNTSFITFYKNMNRSSIPIVRIYWDTIPVIIGIEDFEDHIIDTTKIKTMKFPGYKSDDPIAEKWCHYDLHAVVNEREDNVEY